MVSSNLKIIKPDVYNESLQSSYGYFPYKRPVKNLLQNGIINLDKPSGPTSHEVVATVKKILDIPKAGHSGTLDPNVTGVLPIGLGNSTKILSTLLELGKTYICNLTLNSTPPNHNDLANIIQEFETKIFQFPPKKSNVAKRLRKREIYDLDIIETQDREVLLKIKCESGTYIRTLCNDIGRAYGIESHMKELRRIVSSLFHEKNSKTLHDLFDAIEDYRDGFGDEKIREVVLPMEVAVVHLPVVIINDSAVDPICHGAPLHNPGITAFTPFSPGQFVRLETGKGQLIALGKAKKSSDYISKSNTGTILQPKRVLMERGTYPTYK